MKGPNGALGRSLKGLCRMIDPTIRCDAAETLDELRALEGPVDQPGGE